MAATLHRTNPELLTEQDTVLFGMLVNSLEMYAVAQADIDDKGQILTQPRSWKKYANPSVAIRRQALADVVSLSGHFGLTPSHRATMTVGAVAAVSPDKPKPTSDKRIR